MPLSGKNTARFAVAVAAIILGGSLSQMTAAPTPPATIQRVDDFQLSDQNYLGRRLYKMRDAKAIVLISYVANDRTVQADAATYMALKTGYAAKGVEFLMIDSVPGETREMVASYVKAAGIDIPILFDYEQLVGESLELTRAAEVLIVDPKNWTIAFRGPVGHGQRASLSRCHPKRRAAASSIFRARRRRRRRKSHTRRMSLRSSRKSAPPAISRAVSAPCR